MKFTQETFVTLGIEFTLKGKQLVGDCPFCAKENHLYADPETMLWKCQRCGKKGNAITFVADMANLAIQHANEESAPLKDYCDWKKLPIEAAIGVVGVLPTTDEIIVPMVNDKGAVTDIRRIPNRNSKHKKPMALPGASLGVLRIGNRKAKQVIVCEGESDAIAARWLFEGQDIEIIAVPGASVFKDEWSSMFVDREVVLCYDNDKPGQEGEARAWNIVSAVASSVECVSWGEDKEEGYDLRDFITRRREAGSTRDRIVASFLKLIVANPKIEAEGGQKGVPVDDSGAEIPAVSPAEGLRVYGTVLEMRKSDEEALLVIFGTIMANKIAERDPIWLYVVGASGGGKSEMLGSLRYVPIVYSLTTLTPKTLASGAYDEGGKDPSLLPKLHRKMLVVKDYTAILEMPEISRQEILATLRDAYDGRLKKVFGNGLVRSYHSHFGIIAGVTPSIDGTTADGHLGERFLKFRLPIHDDASERKATMRALKDSGQGEERREKLARAAAGMLHWNGRPSKAPELSDEQAERIVNAAMFVARVRAVPVKNKSGDVMSLPRPEVPTRLASQLGKLARGISWFLGESVVSERAMAIVEQVAKDTPVERRTRLLNALRAGVRTMEELQRDTGYPRSTLMELVEDMTLHDLVQIDKSAKAYRYTLGSAARHVFAK